MRIPINKESNSNYKKSSITYHKSINGDLPSMLCRNLSKKKKRC